MNWKRLKEEVRFMGRFLVILAVAYWAFNESVDILPVLGLAALGVLLIVVGALETVDE